MHNLTEIAAVTPRRRATIGERHLFCGLFVLCDSPAGAWCSTFGILGFCYALVVKRVDNLAAFLSQFAAAAFSAAVVERRVFGFLFRRVIIANA
jgi:hypothetical protein